MNLVAITACPTGIAHTYMAADALKKAAATLNVRIKVETQGAMGPENILTSRDISDAERILIVSDLPVEDLTRFTGCTLCHLPLEPVLLDAVAVLKRILADTQEPTR